MLFDSLPPDTIDIWEWNPEAIQSDQSPFLELLSRYIGVAPQIQKGEHGKPFLDNHPLQFNLSHSGKIALAAFSRSPVGIDVEQEKDRIHMEGLAAKVFTALELAIYQNSSNRKLTFYEGWTKKEAFLKAIGTGISYGLKRCAIPFEPEWAEVQCNEKEGIWLCKPLPVASGYQAAICSQQVCKLRMFKYA